MGRQHWNRLSIRTKAAVTQALMIVIPLVLCLLLIVRQVTTETRMDSALATYQYNRSIVQALDTSVRQLESLANTIAGNRFVRAYVSTASASEREALYRDNISSLMNYAYNRYLPTRNIQLLPMTTLDAVAIDSAVIRARNTYRMWTFDTQDDQVRCRFYYQFSGLDGQSGVLVFTPDMNMLVDVGQNIASINEQSWAVYSLDGRALFAPAGEAAPQLDALARSAAEGYTLVNDSQIAYCVRSETLPLMFISLQNQNTALRYWDRLLPLLLPFLLLITAAVYLSYQTFFRGITQRILSLSNACESLPLDQLSATRGAPAKLSKAPADRTEPDAQRLTIPEMGEDEIGKLSNAINGMLQRITELTDLNARENMLYQRAAYDMLAAQIHPHFIYNTLENLRMMAEVNDDTQVADMLYALGRMLRLSISDPSSTGDIGMEFEHAQMYLQLQQMRMNGNLRCEIAPIPDGIGEMKCPRFLLQPIVENALRYGFDTQKKEDRQLQILSGFYEKGVFLRVWDNGIGITPERMAEINEALRTGRPIQSTRGGIGIINVHTRLQMFYGPDAGLTLESTPGEGTTCTLWLANQQ